MVKTAGAVARKIWRQISRQIFRKNRTLTLPVPARPRGQESGAVPGVLELPPELQPLVREILLRLSKQDNFGRGAAAIASLRALVGDLPASANHHHSGPNGLLRHSLEVSLKMLEEIDKRLAAQAELDHSADVSEISPDAPQWQYLCFLAGLGHDVGKLFDMDVQAGDQRWSPLHETYAEFLRHVKVEPLLRWDEDRVRGAHAQMSPWLMHHLLTPADISFIGVERLPQLVVALTGTHAGDRSTPLASLVSKLDQESVEQAAPEWMTKRPDSKVNQFVRALRTLISDGGLSVNTPGAPLYVTGDHAAIVVPRSIGAVRRYLKQENKPRLPSNHCLYDLLAQAEVVQADGDRQCVKRIRVPGKHGPVELSAVVFHKETIIPQQILPTLPKVTFEIMPENPVAIVNPDGMKLTAVEEQGDSTATNTDPQNAIA
jgi:Putative helicase